MTLKMTRRRNGFVVMAVLVSAAAVITGCSGRGPDLVSNGTLSLEKVNAKGIHVMWVELRQEGEDVIVTGSLVSKGVSNWRRSGHVRVQLLDANGGVVEQACSDLIYMCLRGPGRGPRIKDFKIRMHATASQGETARVTYHLGGDCKS